MTLYAMILEKAQVKHTGIVTGLDMATAGVYQDSFFGCQI